MVKRDPKQPTRKISDNGTPYLVVKPKFKKKYGIYAIPIISGGTHD